MRVSIVTPSFNQARFLEATIQSVLAQSYPDIEYIIMDGGSTDGSQAIIRKYEHELAAWQSQPDAGQTDAINQGFAKATGDVFAWLNSDDTYEPQAVATAVAYLEQHPEAGLFYGDANYIDASGKVVGQFPAAQTSLEQLRQGYVHVPQQAAFFRADLWRQIAPLDEQLYFAMDYDLWIKLAKLSRIAYVPGVVANFRLHHDGKTAQADKQCWDEMLRIHYRDGGKFAAPLVAKYYLRKLAAPYILWKRARMIRNA